MFWEDPRVLVFSVHRHDSGSFYPAGDDGYYNMVGEGPGEGFNINVPWEQGRCGDADYLAAWDHILIPVAKEFSPDIILLSAGFDAAIGDPLGGCRVTPYGYSVMLKKLMEFAQGKIVMALEGGYNLDSIAKSSLACVQVLLEDKPIQGSSEAYPCESTCRVIQAVRKRLCAHWPSLADKLSWKQQTPTRTDGDFGINYGAMDQIIKLITENHQDTSVIMPRLESLFEEALKTPLFHDNDSPNNYRNLKRSLLNMGIQGCKITASSIRSKQQAESLRASLEEKAALHTSDRLRLEDKYAADAKEAAEHVAQIRSEMRQIDLDFHRELFQKAGEEMKLLEGQLQEEASDRLRLRISRDKFAAVAKEAAEHLAKLRSKLSGVESFLNMFRKFLEIHRKLFEKAGGVK